MPPSPWLSARMIRVAYLIDMTTISDQKISETMPSTASGVTWPFGLAAFDGGAQGIERARADVAEHDAHAGERRPPDRTPACLRVRCDCPRAFAVALMSSALSCRASRPRRKRPRPSGRITAFGPQSPPARRRRQFGESRVCRSPSGSSRDLRGVRLWPVRPPSSMISLVISSCRSWRERATSSSSILATLLLAALIARMRASFSAASDSVSASHSSAKTYSSASPASSDVRRQRDDRRRRALRTREAGEIERRQRAVDHLDLARATGAAWTRLTRVARPEPRRSVELLGHPVGERADLVDMGDHRPAPADREAPARSAAARTPRPPSRRSSVRTRRRPLFSARSATSSTRRLNGPANPCSAQIAMTRWPPWPSRGARRARIVVDQRERLPDRRRRPSRRRRARPRHARAPREPAPPRCRAWRRSRTTSCRTERMRATTSLSRSVMRVPLPRRTRARPRRVFRAPRRRTLPCVMTSATASGARASSSAAIARPRLGDLRDRRGVEHAVGERREQRDLIDEAQRGEARLGEQRADALAARDRRLDPRVGDAAEAGEHLEFEELRIVEPESSRRRAQRRRLRLAADAADGRARRRPPGAGCAANSRESSTICPSVIEMRLVGMKAERLPASVSAIGSAVSEPPPSSGASFAARSRRRAWT